jgi:hypothetical protein
VVVIEAWPQPVASTDTHPENLFGGFKVAKKKAAKKVVKKAAKKKVAKKKTAKKK